MLPRSASLVYRPDSNTSISKTLETPPQASRSSTKEVPQAGSSSSEQISTNQNTLFSPGMSARLPTPEICLTSEAKPVQKPQRLGSQQSSAFQDCFNPLPNPGGHFYSANHLFARGVWIGYLAPDRQAKSFRGLPSFSQLKQNFSKFTRPHPPAIEGSVGQNRYGVCRGCAESSSALIELREIQFWRKSVSHFPGAVITLDRLCQLPVAIC